MWSDAPQLERPDLCDHGGVTVRTLRSYIAPGRSARCGLVDAAMREPRLHPPVSLDPVHLAHRFGALAAVTCVGEFESGPLSRPGRSMPAAHELVRRLRPPDSAPQPPGYGSA